MDTSDLSHHILSRFNADLEGVRSGVMQMGGLVEQQLQDGIKALYSGDGRLGEEVALRAHVLDAVHTGRRPAGEVFEITEEELTASRKAGEEAAPLRVRPIRAKTPLEQGLRELTPDEFFSLSLM